MSSPVLVTYLTSQEQGFLQTRVALVSRVGGGGGGVVKQCCFLVAVSTNSSLKRYPCGYLMCTRLEGL